MVTRSSMIRTYAAQRDRRPSPRVRHDGYVTGLGPRAGTSETGCRDPSVECRCRDLRPSGNDHSVRRAVAQGAKARLAHGEFAFGALPETGVEIANVCPIISASGKPEVLGRIGNLEKLLAADGVAEGEDSTQAACTRASNSGSGWVSSTPSLASAATLAFLFLCKASAEFPESLPCGISSCGVPRRHHSCRRETVAIASSASIASREVERWKAQKTAASRPRTVVRRSQACLSLLRPNSRIR